jgi:3-dehydroquinate synthetase
VKSGLIGDASLFEAIEAGGLPADRAELVRRCAAAKAAVVAADEREESGARAVLNLGHTIGHAIELASGYRLLHGEAVALGLVAAARVSARLGRAGSELEGRVAAALGRLGLDTELGPWLRAEVLAHVGTDKKRRGARVRFIALEAVGRCTAVELEPAELARVILS